MEGVGDGLRPLKGDGPPAEEGEGPPFSFSSPNRLDPGPPSYAGGGALPGERPLRGESESALVTAASKRARFLETEVSIFGGGRRWSSSESESESDMS